MLGRTNQCVRSIAREKNPLVTSIESFKPVRKDVVADRGKPPGDMIEGTAQF
jgi:hypothetical protein